MSLRGAIIQVSLSKGGIPKFAVPEAYCDTEGLEGDEHREIKYHGGRRRAILLASDEDLAALRELGFAVTPGSIGENLTIRGVDFRRLRTGMRFRAGGAMLELTRLRSACSNLNIFNSGELRIQEYLYDARCRAEDISSPRWAYGGFYASVLHPGLIRTGDILELVDLVV